MTTVNDSPHIPQFPPMAATVGMFDGVHLGHRAVIDFLQREASQRGLATAVMTFATHPQLLFRPDSDLRLLTDIDSKTALLSDTGIDYAVVFDFTHEFAAMTAYEFLKKIRYDYNVRLLVVGFNHHFGKKSDETFDDYRRYGEELGIEVVAAPELEGNVHVSSSAVRRLLNEGKVAEAAQMLGRRYSLTGTVVAGKRNGRLIGFPTANIDCGSQPLLIPKDGVYAVRVRTGGKKYGGMLNIGTPSVSNDNKRTIEVNIFDFAADIYGAVLTVEFVARVRDCRPMADLNDLQRQLTADRQTVTELLTQSLS